MKNVYEVLRQKEMELTRLEKEVEALRLVAPLLSEEEAEFGHGETRAGHGSQRTAAADPHPGASGHSGGAARTRSWMGRYGQALAISCDKSQPKLKLARPVPAPQRSRASAAHTASCSRKTALERTSITSTIAYHSR